MNNTPTETKAKPTEGPVTVPNGIGPHATRVLDSENRMIADCSGPLPHEQQLANAKFIGEAFNVHHETGLTPREMVERLRKANETLNKVKNFLGPITPAGIIPELEQEFDLFFSLVHQTLKATE